MAVKFLVNVVLFRRISHPEQEKKVPTIKKTKWIPQVSKGFLHNCSG